MHVYMFYRFLSPIIFVVKFAKIWALLQIKHKLPETLVVYQISNVFAIFNFGNLTSQLWNTVTWDGA